MIIRLWALIALFVCWLIYTIYRIYMNTKYVKTDDALKEIDERLDRINDLSKQLDKKFDQLDDKIKKDHLDFYSK